MFLKDEVGGANDWLQGGVVADLGGDVSVPSVTSQGALHKVEFICLLCSVPIGTKLKFFGQSGSRIPSSTLVPAQLFGSDAFS